MLVAVVVVGMLVAAVVVVDMAGMLVAAVVVGMAAVVAVAGMMASKPSMRLLTEVFLTTWIVLIRHY